MRRMRIATVLSVLALTACGQNASDTPDVSGGQGRYAGIGTFDVGKLWGHMAGVKAAADPAAARIADDEHIIVVVDTHTGEVRECGDHSGVCVAMNPWSGPGAAMIAPVRLGKHAADLEPEDLAEGAKAK